VRDIFFDKRMGVLKFVISDSTVVNVGTKIQPTYSTSNSSKLQTRSDSNET
jgi:hypothetical protein